MSDQITLWSGLVDLATVAAGGGAAAAAWFSWRLSERALKVQDKHNRLTQRPYPFLALADYEQIIRVKFVNDGSGPFIIKRVRVCRGNECRSDLLFWMNYPPDGIYWNSFSSALTGRALLPNNEIILLELCGNSADEAFSRFRDECREKLSGLRVLLEFTDSYGTIYPTYERKMDWFARDKGTRKKVIK